MKNIIRNRKIFRRAHIRATLTLGPGIFWLLFFFLIPLFIVFFYSLCDRGTYGDIIYKISFKNYLEALDPIYLKAFLRSFRIATINTLICLFLGYPLAYYISFRSPKIKNLLLLMVIIPFLTNFLVRTYAWMIILRSEGLINSILTGLNVINQPLNLLFTEKAIIIGLVYGYLPFMILPLYASIEKLDFSIVDAAKDLGANTLKIFTKIILPLTLPGIVTGSILVFVPSLGAFITPDLLGGAKNLMIGNVIKDQYLTARNWPLGSAISFILMAIILTLLAIYIRLSKTKE